MQTLKILNAKETKKIYELMKSQWGFDNKLDYVFICSSNDRLYIVNRDFGRIDQKKVRIDSVGLYFGELGETELRLSIEASQIVGPDSKKNILELTKEEMRQWLKGKDIERKTELSGFVLVKNETDFLGCGKVKADKSKVMNFVPKTRRILAED